jgi:tRNA threonylcarbamoyladenosine biosynthesis protein TsaE
MRDLNLRSASSEATRKLGERLGRALLEVGDDSPIVLALNGELGAGKTTLIAGLLGSWGVQGIVRSPTYTLVEPYENLGPSRNRAAFHLDLYRLSGKDDLTMLALRDMLQPGAVLLVEWAERAEGNLPPADIEVNLRYGGKVESTDDRSISFAAQTSVGTEVLRRVAGQ